MEAVEFPATYPAFRRIMTDPADNLWVEEYPAQGGPVTWRVYSPDRQRLATLTTPWTNRILDLGDEHVVTISEDDLGVDYVHTFRLLKPGPR